MITKIIEAVQSKTRYENWGKFLVMKPDVEWERRSEVDMLNNSPLLRQRGWGPDHVWVLDLETGEGGYFSPGGVARADLKKHQIWVCPLFEPFLTWLYLQDLSDISKLPDLVELPDAEFEFRGYRRQGKK